jgi:aspartyl-tRNA(Asn)/glutamyl-tRNA(Gln) amidotransferase subunit C
VLKYVEKLREVDVTGVDATAHALPVFNVFRDDAPRDWFTAEQALSNAPRQANGLFVVPKVVE